MSLLSWLGFRRTASRAKGNGKRRLSRRLHVERLEDRMTPASYSAATVPELIAAIDAANLTPEADTISLTPSSTFTLTEVNNTSNGATGLPTIATGENLTILGNSGIIERSTASGTPAFRLFDVTAGASLTLENVTLQGGVSFGPGGAIHSQGTLALRDATVQNNKIAGSLALGGGIFSGGSLTLENCSIRNNQALGYEGGFSGRGGDAFGGGLYIGGGTANLIGTTLSLNTARGGDGGIGEDGWYDRGGDYNPPGNGGDGGNGFGGGLYAAAGSVELHNCTITQNAALGGAGGAGGDGRRPGRNGSPGLGIGGGLYIDSAALACLDAFTVDHLKRNKARSDPNIHGSYTICP